ncbi:MAG TPA: glycosyltransferase family A protein [Pyrinomonadaceae bacterium]|nr:glycosyltransferase family A protein [Pyrinomonadaceae bacterium]
MTDALSNVVRETNATPAVSVVIPAYNAAAHVGEAVASVRAQTFQDFELIVVNDGSPDTPALERALAPYGEGLVYLKQENAGPSAARNAGVRRARGRFVAFLDSDDAWEPAYLAEQLKAFEEDPALDLVYADALIVGDTALAGKTFMQCHPSRGAVTAEALLREDCTVLTSCVVARREALLDAGLFDEKFRRSEDFDLWVRMAHGGARLGYQRKVLARHRRHGKSLTSDYIRMYDSQLEVFSKLRDVLGGEATLRGLAEWRLERCAAEREFERGKRSFVEGRYEEAVASLARANEFLRSTKLRLALLLLRASPRLLRRAYLARHRSSPRDALTALRG